MNKETNKYETAVNAANNLIDTIFGAFGVDGTKYHMTEEQLKKAIDDTKENVSTKTDSVTELINKFKKDAGIDFTNFAETLNNVMDKYKEKYYVHKVGDDDDSMVPAIADIVDEYELGDKEPDQFECTGDCENCPFCDEEFDKELFDDEPDYAEVGNNLKARLENADDTEEFKSIAYPYISVWDDLYYILKEETEELEIVTDGNGNKSYQITYHVGYETETEYDTIMSYVEDLKLDLIDAYGFTDVYFSTENNDIDKYVTFYINLIF